MKICIIDTETSNLPVKMNASWKDTENWPWIVQLAYQIVDTVTKKVIEKKFTIKPENWTISEGAISSHGITNEYARACGLIGREVFNEFACDLQEIDLLVAHNVNFDLPILKSNLYRYGFDADLLNIQTYCTMIKSVSYCKIEGKFNKYKWPKLIELHTILFNEGFDGAHDALNDVRACSRCFFQMMKMHKNNEHNFL